MHQKLVRDSGWTNKEMHVWSPVHRAEHPTAVCCVTFLLVGKDPKSSIRHQVLLVVTIQLVEKQLFRIKH